MDSKDQASTEDSSIPQEFKDKLQEVLDMCDTKECYEYLEQEVNTKGEDYKEESADESETSETPEEFSADDMPTD